MNPNPSHIALALEVPEELVCLLREFLEAHPDLSEGEVFVSALKGYLLQEQKYEISRAYELDSNEHIRRR